MACQEFCVPDFSNFCLCVVILIFAAFSLIFDARKKIISASDRLISGLDFLFLSDF